MQPYLQKGMLLPFWKLRHKTKDERFFILTLFAIAMEAEGKVVDVENTVLNVDLPVGLPPKHYGALLRSFRIILSTGVSRYSLTREESTLLRLTM